MAFFGGSFSDFLTLPWEQARGFIKEELEQLKTALQGILGALVNSDGTLSEAAFGGTGANVPSYLANTGTNKAPKWEKIDLTNGVKNRIKYSNLPTGTANAQSVIGFSSTGQSFQEIYVRNSIPDLKIYSDQLVLQETAVVAGTYGDVGNIPRFVVDSKGRITNVTLVPLSAAPTAISYIPLSLGIEPLTFASDGVGTPILIPYTP